jgi:hypothetical protein
MEIRIDASTDGEPSLLDPSDFKAFKVVVRAGDPGRARPDLGSVADWVDDGHVAVSVDAVRALAGEQALTPDWEKGFSAMLGYAESKGWMVGDAIRAHVDWES